MSFAVPLFLLAMLAALIPVLLHMINLQKAKTIPFSTLRFLRLGVEKTRRRKYLHDILLLAFRAAALLLIALALAKPTVTHFGGLLGSGDASAVVLILDNSSSMSTVDVGGSRWEAALAATYEILDRLDQRDSVALLLTCGPPRPALDQLYQNLEVVRETLAECRVRYEKADLLSRIRKAESLLQDSSAPNKEIYVITDMQAVSWDSSMAAEPAPAGQELPPVVLVDVHRETLANAALIDVTLQSAGPVAGMPIQATVRLQGDLKLDQQRHVELLIDDQTIETSPTITIPAAATAEHSFNFTVDQPGIHTGVVRLRGDDACGNDNQRLFAISAARNIPVAVIKPNEHEISYLEDSYYLERALNPVGGGDWAIQVDSLLPGALTSAPLRDYAIVFCVNLPALDAPYAARLRDYVRGGGHVVWICGDNVEAGLYNGMNQSAGGELLPVSLTRRRESESSQDGGWNIGWIDVAHPALAAFAQPQSLYQSVLVSKYIAVDAVDQSLAKVLAKLDDGDPLLIERPVGSGSVLFLGTSVHVAWSNLPLRPLFLPLLARLTFYLADANAAQGQLSAGNPIPIIDHNSDPGAVEPDDGQRSHELTLPDGNIVRLDAESDRQRSSFADTHEIGIYRLRSLRQGDPRERAFAVNLDPHEVPAAISAADRITPLVGEDRLLVCRDVNEIESTIRRLREGRSLMELFLIAVLIVLIAEAYLANRRVEQEQPDELREVRSSAPNYRRLPDQLDKLSEFAQP